jgi:hypothetical protein
MRTTWKRRWLSWKNHFFQLIQATSAWSTNRRNSVLWTRQGPFVFKGRVRAGKYPEMNIFSLLVADLHEVCQIARSSWMHRIRISHVNKWLNFPKPVRLKLYDYTVSITIKICVMLHCPEVSYLMFNYLASCLISYCACINSEQINNWFKLTTAFTIEMILNLLLIQTSSTDMQIKKKN